MFRVEDLVAKYETRLGLALVAGKAGIKRPIPIPEAHRPGLSLAGYLRGYVAKRVLVFGKVELDYLLQLSGKRKESLLPLLGKDTPCIIIARRQKPIDELVSLCNELQIPLFRSKLSTTSLLGKLTHVFDEEFAPTMVCHGTLVEVFGVGVLIQGGSSVGKSEAALALIERGHRLIADDAVQVKKREGEYLEGSGAELTRHHIEIRGIGILNVAYLYGAVCVRDSKNIDLVVFLEAWDDSHTYDRVGIEEKTCDFLGVDVPFHVLPVKPGRDVALLLETIALNYRLKKMGFNFAREFSIKLQETMAKKRGKKR